MGHCDVGFHRPAAGRDRSRGAGRGGSGRPASGGGAEGLAPTDDARGTGAPHNPGVRRRSDRQLAGRSAAAAAGPLTFLFVHSQLTAAECGVGAQGAHPLPVRDGDDRQ